MGEICQRNWFRWICDLRWYPVKYENSDSKKPNIFVCVTVEFKLIRYKTYNDYILCVPHDDSLETGIWNLEQNLYLI